MGLLMLLCVLPAQLRIGLVDTRHLADGLPQEVVWVRVVDWGVGAGQTADAVQHLGRGFTLDYVVLLLLLTILLALVVY